MKGEQYQDKSLLLDEGNAKPHPIFFKYTKKSKPVVLIYSFIFIGLNNSYPISGNVRIRNRIRFLLRVSGLRIRLRSCHIRNRSLHR